MSPTHNTEPAKRRAFVLMPFSTDFNEVYEYLIRDPLESAGYATNRADDFLNQSSILEDIVRSIALADIIVADLTTTNPNVYYELGLAHGMRKRVVLITQSLSEVPFDLRAYRIISYSTHFSKIGEAKALFAQLLTEIAADTLRFGSPVTDYIADDKKESHAMPSEAVDESASVSEDNGHLGLIDYQVNLENSATEMEAFITELSGRLGRLNPELTDSAAQLAAEPPIPARAKQQILRRLGSIVDGHASWLKTANRKYSQTVQNFADSFDGLLTQSLTAIEADSELRETLANILRTLEDSTAISRSSTLSLSQTIRTGPLIEKSFNVASSRLADELDELSGHHGRVLSAISRFRGMCGLDRGPNESA